MTRVAYHQREHQADGKHFVVGAVDHPNGSRQPNDLQRIKLVAQVAFWTVLKAYGSSHATSTPITPAWKVGSSSPTYLSGVQIQCEESSAAPHPLINIPEGTWRAREDLTVTSEDRT